MPKAAKAAVTARVEFDSSRGFSTVGGLHESNRPRDIALEIRKQDSGYRIFVQVPDPDLARLFGEHLEHDLPLTPAEVWGNVQKCRKIWNSSLVHLVQPPGTNCHPLQEQWDFGPRNGSGSQDLQGPAANAMPDLAKASSRLFQSIFFKEPVVNPGLRDLGIALRKALDTKSCWLKVFYDDLHIPWELLYSAPMRPDGSDWKPEGFWGYQHVIEAAPLGSGNIAFDLKESAEEPFVVGLQLDENVDANSGLPCIQSVEDLLVRYPPDRLLAHKRLFRQDFLDELYSGALKEQLLFFCCHSVVDGVDTQLRLDEAYLTLSDQSLDKTKDRIVPDDIRQWLDQRNFYEHGSRPLIFLNACGSGQLNSIFYSSFGKTFLDLGACSVIGAQVELPIVFAGEFASRFLERFLAGGQDNQIGKVLFDLRRYFFDQHSNPLGLIYSLYRGADVYLRHPP